MGHACPALHIGAPVACIVVVPAASATYTPCVLLEVVPGTYERIPTGLKARFQFSPVPSCMANFSPFVKWTVVSLALEDTVSDVPGTKAGVVVEVDTDDEVVVLIGLEVAMDVPAIGLVVALG
jgi:hypothetical protein